MWELWEGRHTEPNCYQKGGGKEGQATVAKEGKKDNKKGEKKTEETANTAHKIENSLHYLNVRFFPLLQKPSNPKSKRGAIIDSGASRQFCPDRSSS